jgi:hypothetical protein
MKHEPFRCLQLVMSKGNAPLDQQRVLAGLHHLIDWVSAAPAAAAAVVVAAAGDAAEAVAAVLREWLRRPSRSVCAAGR